MPPVDTLIDPNDVKDYAFDWTAALLDGETITTRTITGTNITVDRDELTGGVVTAWVSAAQPRPSIACKITTNQGRTYERTITLTLTQR